MTTLDERVDQLEKRLRRFDGSVSDLLGEMRQSIDVLQRACLYGYHEQRLAAIEARLALKPGTAYRECKDGDEVDMLTCGQALVDEACSLWGSGQSIANAAGEIVSTRLNGRNFNPDSTAVENVREERLGARLVEIEQEREQITARWKHLIEEERVIRETIKERP